MNTTMKAGDPDKPESSSGGILDRLMKRLGFQDLGMLPIILGLAAIWIIFQIANRNFLRPVNLTNLTLQIVGTGVISVGMVLILFLGEMDLSVGSLSGLGAAVMSVLSVKMGLSGPLAVLLGILVGTAVGLFQGNWIARLRIPSFIVTLAGQLTWLGALLYVLGPTGTINLLDPFVTGLAGTFLPQIAGWAIGGAYTALNVYFLFSERRQRVAQGLDALSFDAVVARSVITALLVLGSVAVFNTDRGLPLSVLIFVGLIAIFDQIIRRTTFGRHVMAVGGDPEAARRASINVERIRVSIFTLASTLAAFGGIMAGSRLMAVSQSSGSGDVLLNAIAAGVIGGTSLFGGRGSVWSVLVGSLVIGSIANGMDLLALQSSIKFMITGGVLLIAVTIDAVSRRRREAAGR